MEISIDAARARVRKLEADLALERKKCDCHSDERRALEREARAAKDVLHRMEEEALAQLK